MGGPSMRVILLGQPELRQAITAIPQLAQRVKLFFHLEGLSPAETADYIDYRLLVSGHGGNRLFDDDTVREIHRISGGIPRLINKLCDGMLMCAYSEDRPFIDPYDLESIRTELLGEEPELDRKKRPAPGSRATPQDRIPTLEPEQATTVSERQWRSVAGSLERIASALERIESRLSVRDSETLRSNRDRSDHEQR